jgi:Tfp pilus assembly protein PilN
VEAVVSRARRAGIALSNTELFISFSGAEASGMRIALAAGPTDRGSWPELATALRQVAPGDGAGELAVALLSPLVEVARLDLPPIAEAEMIQLLTRNAGRYFVSARGTQTIGVIQGRARRGEAATVLAAATATRMIAAIDSAAREAGWTVSMLTPAEGAWGAAALRMWPSFGRHAAYVLVHEADRTVLLELREGRVVGVRRFRPGAQDAESIADAIRNNSNGTASVGSFGAAAGRQELLRDLGARGIAVNAAASSAAFADVPAMVAAANAAESAGPLLMNEQAREVRRAKRQRAAILVGAAAVMLVGIAMALGLWGAKRELRLVQQQRADVRPQVAATLVGRTSVEDAYRRLSAVAAAERGAPHWAPVLAELSAIVPDDAYFTAFRTRGDSLVVDGMAARAARVFDAIRSNGKSLTAVRAPAPVRAEAPDGGDPLERFSIAGVLKRAASVTPRDTSRIVKAGSQ